MLHAFDYDTELKSKTDTSSLSPRKFPLRESIFQPSVIGKEASGIHDTSLEYVLKGDSATRKELYAIVVLSDGMTMLKGFLDARRRNRRWWLHLLRDHGDYRAANNIFRNQFPKSGQRRIINQFRKVGFPEAGRMEIIKIGNIQSSYRPGVRPVECPRGPSKRIQLYIRDSNTLTGRIVTD